MRPPHARRGGVRRSDADRSAAGTPSRQAATRVGRLRSPSSAPWRSAAFSPTVVPMNPVLLVHEYEDRSVLGHLGVGILRVTDHHHAVAGLRETRGRAIQADLALAPRSGNDVGLEASAIIDVHHVNLLVLEQIRSV